MFNILNSILNVFNILNSILNMFNIINSIKHVLNIVNSMLNVFNILNSIKHIKHVFNILNNMLNTCRILLRMLSSAFGDQQCILQYATLHCTTLHCATLQLSTLKQSASSVHKCFISYTQLLVYNIAHINQQHAGSFIQHIIMPTKYYKIENMSINIHLGVDKIYR